jgi:enoyl-CoA hydratase/carnithine racemase
VPAAELDAVAYEMAERIAASPGATVRMARRVIANLADHEVRTSMADELIFQTYVVKSDDMAEFRAARAEKRAAKYTGS